MSGMALIHSGNGESGKNDSESVTSSGSSDSDCTSGSGYETLATEYSEDETDLNMPPLTNVDDDDKEDDDMSVFNNDEIPRDATIEQCLMQMMMRISPVKLSLLQTHLLPQPLKGCTPAITLTFMDSGTSDYFF